MWEEEGKQATSEGCRGGLALRRSRRRNVKSRTVHSDKLPHMKQGVLQVKDRGCSENMQEVINMHESERG